LQEDIRRGENDAQANSNLIGEIDDRLELIEKTLEFTNLTK